MRATPNNFGGSKVRPNSRFSLGVSIACAVAFVALPLVGVFWAASGGVKGTSHAAIEWGRLVAAGGRTVLLAAASSALCLAVGVPVAIGLHRYRFPGRQGLLALSFVPFVLPTLAVAGGVSSLMGRGGWLEWIPGEPGDDLVGSSIAILLANLVFNLGLVIRMMGPAVSAVDTSILDSATVLGLTRTQAWRRVGLPSLRPSMARCAVVVALLAATNFALVLILGSPASSTVDLEIWYSVTQAFDLRSAAVMTAAQLCVLGAIVAVFLRPSHNGAQTPLIGGSRAQRDAELPKLASGGTALFAAVGSAFVVVAIVGLPIAALVRRTATVVSGGSGGRLSLDRFVAPLREPPVRLRGLWGSEGAGVVWTRSLVVALGVGLIVAAIGLAVAGRFSRGGGRSMELILVTSMAISPAALGLGMLAVAQIPIIERLLRATGSSELALLMWAMTAATLPFGLAIIADAGRGVSPRLVEAARVLGCTPADATRRVVLAVVAPSVIVAGGLAAAVAFGEVGVASFVTDGSAPVVAVVARRFMARAQPDAYQLGLGLALWVAVLGATLSVLAEIVSRLALRLARRSR
jgi:thiamine transport system permease protein